MQQVNPPQQPLTTGDNDHGAEIPWLREQCRGYIVKGRVDLLYRVNVTVYIYYRVYTFYSKQVTVCRFQFTEYSALFIV